MYGCFKFIIKIFSKDRTLMAHFIIKVLTQVTFPRPLLWQTFLLDHGTHFMEYLGIFRIKSSDHRKATEFSLLQISFTCNRTVPKQWDHSRTILNTVKVCT